MKPRLLDLFCGAGGAGMGYHRAGFEVVGVDINPQPRYPFEFHQADALEFPLDGFDVIHASPPCQAFTALSNRWRGAGGVADAHEDLIAPTRDRLQGRRYVIENVHGAPLLCPIVLTGEMFGLRVYRPRLFECVPFMLAPDKPPRQRDPVAVYGKPDGRLLWRRKDGTEQHASDLETGSAAMGIDWMEWDELKESIPPAYTEYIGRQLLNVL